MSIACPRDNMIGLSNRGLEAESSGKYAAQFKQGNEKVTTDALIPIKSSNLIRHCYKIRSWRHRSQVKIISL